MLHVASKTLLLCFCTTVAVWAQPLSTVPSEDAPVVVLPFVNMSPEIAAEWLSLGIANTIRSDISRVGGAPVLITHAAPLSPHWLISGTYQRVGDELHITARLRDPAGNTVQTVRVDGPVADVFVLQDRITIALGISPSDTPDANAAAPMGPDATRGTRDPSASPAENTSDDTGPTHPIPQWADMDPPPPVPPAVESRNTTGGATVRAVRLTKPLTLDGRLAESVYQEVAPIGGFLQQEPNEGAPATEQTEVWIFFDDDNIYVSARCWQSRMDQVVANEMRRDEIFQNDHFAIVFDTYYDQRKGYLFRANPVGGMMDLEFTEGPTFNTDWNTVWNVRTSYFDGGWNVEFSIPFRSLRYPSGTTRPWGVNLARTVLSKNERSYLTLIPASLGTIGLTTSTYAGNLVGLEVPSSSTNIEVKPYVIGGLTNDYATTPPVQNNLTGGVGFDAKYSITQSLTADFTVNTDFAQVEVDEQQVNLTRFNLFFPEKREFFLEGQGVFEFGGGRGFTGRSSASYQQGMQAANTPVLFFSRRIGLENGRVVPIVAGGRLTGKVGPLSIGALNIQSDNDVRADVAAANFSVLRIKSDVLRRSTVGGILTNRSVSATSPGTNQAYGLDGVFSFYDNVNVNTYIAQTNTEGLVGDDASYRGQLNYTGDRYGVQVEQLSVGANFNPGLGFVRRYDFRRSFASARFSPRPQRWQSIRKISWEASLDYTTDRSGLLETRVQSGIFGLQFENSDELFLGHTVNYEFLKAPFDIHPGVTISSGGYDFHNTRLGYSFGPQRWFSGNSSVEHGTFFGGEKTSLTLTRPRLNLVPKVTIEPTLSLNWLDLPQASFSTTLVSSRITYTLTPRLFASTLVQYNSGANAVGTNARLRWEYQPGSELFVVYTEERDTISLRPERHSLLRNRGFVVKLTRLFRF